MSLVVLAVMGVLQSDRGLWQDESMLLANLGQPLSTYFRSLPFYDQAAPPLALIVLDGVRALAGGSVQAMRLVMLALQVALFATLAFMAHRRGDRTVLLTLAVIAVTPAAIRYCVELKQYIFELDASLLFVLALRWRPDRAAWAIALAALLSFLSFSVMLVVGVATLDAVLFRLRGALQRRWLILLFAYTLGWLACYLLIFRPAIALQTANYAIAYERLPLASYWRDPALLQPQFEAIARAQAVIALGGLLLGILAAVIARRSIVRDLASFTNGWRPASDAWQPLRVFAGLIGLAAVLWLAKLYPISSFRQLLFTLPLGAMVLAQVALAACRSFEGRAASTAVIVALLGPSALYASYREAGDRSTFQDTSGLYRFIRENRSALILPETQFEPTLRHYAARDPQPPRIAGLLRPESHPMETPQEALAALSVDDAPVYQHVYLPFTAARAFPVYARWLLRHARGQGETILAAAQFDSRYEAVVIAESRRQGCTARVGYRSHDVVAFRIHCPRIQPAVRSGTG